MNKQTKISNYFISINAKLEDKVEVIADNTSVKIEVKTEINCDEEDEEENDIDMYYLSKNLLKAQVKFTKKIKCSDCGFRLCEINKKQTCLWCFNEHKLMTYNITYGKYKNRAYAFILQNDFDYCMYITFNKTIISYHNNELIIKKNIKGDTRLTHLTKKILGEIPLSKCWC